MTLKPKTILLISTLFVLAGVAATLSTGLWQTESTKIPKRLEATTTTQGAEGAYDPADIRGSYAFGEISRLYGVPLADLAQAFGLTTAESEAFQAKELEQRYPDAEAEIGTASVRLFVADYLGLPYTPSEDTWLPASAAPVLVASGRMTAEQADYLTAHTLP